MSTSVLYRVLGIRGYKHQSMREQDGGLVLRARHDGSEVKCPHCDSSHVVHRGTVPGSWKAPPIGDRPVTVFADVPRIECRDCGAEPLVPVPFADPRRSYTRRFEERVLALRQSMTIQDVAWDMGISEWTVRDIEKRYLQKHFAKPPLKHLRHIAIDEISTKKGHTYRHGRLVPAPLLPTFIESSWKRPVPEQTGCAGLTLVMDLESGAVVFVGRGKGAEALEPFWKRPFPIDSQSDRIVDGT